ncbi:MAG TPA: heme-binding domain-containing protein [Candidatus Binatia bacterium]
MRKWLMRAGVVLAAAVAAIQVVPVERSNPPVESDIAAPDDVKKILRRSCYDCHSNETRWPWYARVAPVSWLISSDVSEGRREVNFSVWSQFTGGRRARKFKEIVEQIEGNKMPQWYYLLLHSEAKLAPGDKEIILNWAKQALQS